jgi:hypothetical protein
LSRVEKLSEEFGLPEMDLDKVLSEVRFVSAAACGSKGMEKLMLFYLRESSREPGDIRFVGEDTEESKYPHSRAVGIFT